MSEEQVPVAAGSSNGAGGSGADTVTITDNRTGESIELPIEDGTLRATALRQIKEKPDDFGLMTYDPAYLNTASCRSAITSVLPSTTTALSCLAIAGRARCRP